MLQEIINYVMSVFQGQDQIALASMAAIVVIAGLMLGAFGSLIRFTLIALVVFGGAMLARRVFMDGAEPVGLVQQSGNEFAAMQMGTFLVYFIAFAVVIAGIYLVKSMVRRGAH
jgi:hypothetical protein